METLAKYDPYAIEEIEFFVHKKSKYTTLKSILVTLAILALTIYLNITVISHLWIQRYELPLVSTSRKMSLEPFSSSYLCILPRTKNFSLPRTTLINVHRVTGDTIKNFTLTDKFQTNSQILASANGREFACYDMEGMLVSAENMLIFLIHSAGGGEFDLMFKTFSFKELIGDPTEKSNFFYLNGKQSSGSENVRINIQIKKISAIYKDKLLIDYEPETVFGFSTDHAPVSITNSDLPNTSYVNIYSEFQTPYDLTNQYQLSRYNISDILGRILSWFSLFVMICAFVVTPILDYNYRVQLAQKLYDNQKLNPIDISLLSYAKFLFSKLKKGLFNETVLNTAFEKLEKDIDLLNIIKRQALMKKLIKENQTLNHSHKELQNRNSELGLDLTEVLLSSQPELDINSEKNQSENMNLKEKNTETDPFVTEPDELSGDNFITGFVKSLDISEVEISLISNKGEGYKTSWNIILTVIFLGLVFWFILSAGLFELSPNYTLETISMLNDGTLFPQTTFSPNDIIFRVNKTATDKFNLSAVLIDKYDQIIANLTLNNGPTCNQNVQAMNESIGSGWMCLNDSITLQNNPRDNEIKLGLRLKYTGFSFFANFIEVKIRQYNLVDNELVQELIHFEHQYIKQINYVYSSQSLIFDDDESQDGMQFYWTLNKFKTNYQTIFKGVSIKLNPEFIRVKKIHPSIWDLINNAWGIFVVAFTVFLSKITRYLNVKKRENITRNEENENRNDIVAIILTQYKLIQTVFMEELKQVKYFYKTKMDDWQPKEN